MYYTHIEPNVTTIDQLLTRSTIRSSLFTNVNKEKFLDISVDDGLEKYKIRDKIFEFYTPVQQEEVLYDAKNITLSSPINTGTTFWIDDNYIIKDFLFTQTKNIIPTTNTNSFIAEHVKELFSDKGYVKTSTFASYKKISNEFQVFMWCRALKRKKLNTSVNVAHEVNHSDGSPSDNGYNESTSYSNEKGGDWINLTSFISSIDTTVTEAGGNFSFDIAPIMCKYNEEDDSWVLEDASMVGNVSSLRDAFYAKTTMHKIEKGELSRSNLFFHNMISDNDLVYIRFESLDMENESPKRNLNIRVSANDVVTNIPDDKGKVKPIGGNVYDMIGLVDRNRLTSGFKDKNVLKISIQGRDLVKAFIDDGTYFFPKEFSSGSFFMSGGVSTQNKLLQRNLFNANITSLSVYQEKDIQYIMQFLISQMSNTGYVPNNVFNVYGKRRNKTINIDDKLSDNKNNKDARLLADKLKEKIKEELIINDNYCINKNIQYGLESANGYDYDSQIQRVQFGIQKLIDWADFMLSKYDEAKYGIPAYTYNGNLYKDNVYPIELLGSALPAYRPIKSSTSTSVQTFNASGVEGQNFTTTAPVEQETEKVNVSNAYVVDGSEYIHLANALELARQYISAKNSVCEDEKVTKEEYLKGIWQIIDVVIDDNVRNRILVDTSIAGHTGNIYSAMQRVCVKPFAETIFDTYGDRYCVIIRQQPFDYNGVNNCITGKNLNYRSVFSKGKKVNSPSPSPDYVQGLTPRSTNKYLNILDEDIKISSGANDNYNLVIDIPESVISNDEINWYSGEVYTWYRINPQGYLFGSGSALTWLFLPAIYLPEYVEIWGSRPWVLNSPYIVDKSYELDSNSGFKKDPLLIQSYFDLKYMIDSTCYLPFTKNGTITISGGDRRIKRGTWVRRNGTGEVFYVESVQNIGDFGDKTDRKTILTVSHGMIEKYIQPVDEKGYKNPISYFNLINTKLNFEYSKNSQSGQIEYDSNSNIMSENVLKNFKVNSDVLDFFISKNQFK